MAIRRFSGSWKTRDDVMDNITPNNVVQPNVSVPAGEWKPAAWLPIVWTGEASKDSFVISSGKVVAFDGEGRIVPAGYAKIFGDAAALSTSVLTYTSADVSAGVISLATGATCTAGAVRLDDLAEALLSRGLVEHESVASGFAVAGTFDKTELGDCQLVCEAFISDPVGICAYDVYVWAGDSADQLNYLNYQKQHLIQFFTDMQLQVPHAALATATTGALSTAAAWTAAAAVDGEHFPSAEKAGSELFLTSTQIASLDKYSSLVSAGDDVVAIALQEPPAVNTERTPIESSGALLTRERTSIAKLAQAGDWYLDADARLLFLWEEDGDALPAGAGTQTVTFYHYDNLASSADRQICAVGDIKAGDYLTFDDKSNFVKLDVDASTLPGDICGRVLAIVSQPKGLLERVRTAWDGSSFSSSEQMPGTATAGYTDLITLSPENVDGTSGVADQVVLINVKMS